MVAKPNWTGSPVVGCCHVRTASAVIAAFSSPLAGGAANSWPITEKRRCAHRSWTREPRACWIMPMPLDRRAPTVEATAMRRRRASCADEGTPLSSVRAASGDGADEAQQRDEAIGAVTGEAFEERRRQTLVVDRRHERAASNLPQPPSRHPLAPPPPPPPHTPPVT